MIHIADHQGRPGALASAAVVLLALCLLAGGAQALTGPADGASLTAGANTTIAPNTTMTPAARALAPYPGAHAVPGSVQAEDFDAGGEGVAYHDVEPANLGGAYRPAEGVDIEKGAYITDVGWIRSGEWLGYTVTASEPQPIYLLLSAANPDATTKPVTYSLNGTVAGTVDVHPTGGFDRYDGHFTTPFTFPAGETVVRLSFGGVSRINLDSISLETPPPGPAPTPAPDLLVDTPGLHTLDRDITTDWIGVDDQQLRRRLRRHGPQHRGHGRRTRRASAPPGPGASGRPGSSRTSPSGTSPSATAASGIALGGGRGLRDRGRRRRAERRRARDQRVRGHGQRPSSSATPSSARTAAPGSNSGSRARALPSSAARSPATARG